MKVQGPPIRGREKDEALAAADLHVKIVRDIVVRGRGDVRGARPDVHLVNLAPRLREEPHASDVVSEGFWKVREGPEEVQVAGCGGG